MGTIPFASEKSVSKSDLHAYAMMAWPALPNKRKQDKKEHADRSYRKMQTRTHSRTQTLRFDSFKLAAATAAAAEDDTTRMCARCLCECIIFIPNKWPAAKFTVAFYKKIICVYHFRRDIMCARWRRWWRRRRSSQVDRFTCIPVGLHIEAVRLQ